MREYINPRQKIPNSPFNALFALLCIVYSITPQTISSIYIYLSVYILLCIVFTRVDIDFKLVV